MENKMTLSIILVNWNCGQVIIDCLESLYFHIKDVDYEIIVVDNNSTDGTREYIENNFPRVVLTKNNFNNLFAGANNQGYGISRGEYIWILNADTVLFENSVKKMLGVLDNPQIGAVTSKLLNKDGSVQYYMHRRFPTYLNMFFLIVYKICSRCKTDIIKKYFYLDNNFEKNFYIEQAAGTSILLKREVIEKIGGLFDEKNFPLFLNDVDLSFRLHIHGYMVMCVCETAIFHMVGQSTSKIDFFERYLYYVPSLLLFFKKHKFYKDFYITKIYYTAIFLLLSLFSLFLFFIGKLDLQSLKKRFLLIKTIIQTN